LSIAHRRPRGSGSITYDKAKDRYRIRWPIAGDPVGGSRLVDGSRIDAERELRAELNARDAGAPKVDRRMTVDAWLTRWLDGHVATLAIGTQVRYRDIADRLIRPALGRRKLAELRASDLETFKAALIRAGHDRRGADSIVDVLSAALGRAVKDKVIASNPRERVARERKVRRPILPPSRAEADALLRDAAGDPVWFALYALAIGHGLRQSEVLGLRRRHRSRDGLMLTIEAKAEHRTRRTDEEPKDGSVGSVILFPWVASALDALGDGPPDSLLFPAAVRRSGRKARAGVPMHPRTLLADIHERSARLELARRYTWHDMRRAFGTRLAAAGNSPHAIQGAMRHADYRSTLHYLAPIGIVDDLEAPESRIAHAS
jgi:integrase